MKQHFGKYLGPTLIDEAQPITAWRTWRLLESRPREVRLVGTWATKTEWEPNGGVTVAQCLAEKKGGCNLTMRPDCNCGLWACVALSNLLKHGAVGLFPRGVLGRVHLWGFVHVYTFGFRASMGRPLDVWLGNSDGRAAGDCLARTYRIPVHLGLPCEVVDPDLLPAPRVLSATLNYQLAQGRPVVVKALPPPAAPNGGRKCSGCGAPGTRIDRCAKCKGQRAAAPVTV